MVIGIGGRGPGGPKDTGHNIRETGEFVVNLVGHDNLRQMNVTAIEFPPEVDELAEAGLTTAAERRRWRRRASPKARWRWSAAATC